MTTHPLALPPGTPPEVTIPAPRGAAEPTRHLTRLHGPGRGEVREVRDEPGWLSLVEALDRFAAALVARYEHELTRATGPAGRERLHRQLAHARDLETTTARAVTDAQHRTLPASTPATTHRPA